MISTDIKALNAIARGSPDNALGPSLMTTKPYPLYYRMIAKCGSTFILNVFYYLNYGHTNQDPFLVHKKIQIIPDASAASNQDITDSPYAFVVIRDPIKRFMSLYFDKLYSIRGTNRLDNLGKYFTEKGLIIQNIGDDADKHRENCIRSIKWIKQNLARRTDRKPNWHWKPQKLRLKQVHKLRFNVLMLEDITFQLPYVLKSLVPQISDAMKAVSAQNISKKPLHPEAVLNEELCGLIHDTYPNDTEIYQEVSAYWRDLKKNSNG